MKYLVAGMALLIAATAFGADLREQVSGYRAAHEAAIVGQLDELTRFRSVAADPKGLAAAAAHLEELLKTRGFETQSWSTAGSPPVVYGFLKSPGANAPPSSMPITMASQSCHHNGPRTPSRR